MNSEMTAKSASEPAEGVPRISAYEALNTGFAALETVLGSAEGPDWARDALQGLMLLEQGLTRHCEVSEEPGGSLDQIVALKPSLVHATMELRGEHASLRTETRRLREGLTALSPDALDENNATRRALNELSAAVREHMERGADLLYNAYFQEEGGRG